MIILILLLLFIVFIILKTLLLKPTSAYNAKVELNNNERSKEEAFLNNLLSRKDIPPKLQQEISQLSLNPFDYNKFIKIINEYFLGVKNFERLKIFFKMFYNQFHSTSYI